MEYRKGGDLTPGSSQLKLNYFSLQQDHTDLHSVSFVSSMRGRGRPELLCLMGPPLLVDGPLPPVGILHPWSRDVDVVGSKTVVGLTQDPESPLGSESITELQSDPSGVVCRVAGVLT